MLQRAFVDSPLTNFGDADLDARKEFSIRVVLVAKSLGVCVRPWKEPSVRFFMDHEFGNGLAFSPFTTDVDGAPYARRDI